MIVAIKNHGIATVVFLCLALFGEYSLLKLIHSWIEWTNMPDSIDVVIDSIFVLLFVLPVLYYFFVMRQMFHHAMFDHLTGLFNRVHFNKSHSDLINRKMPFQLMLLDLCKFKEINDTHGHLIGDEVLRVVAERIRKTVGNKGTVSRLGGDEFVILLPRATTREIADTIASEIRQPILTGDLNLEISISIGITDYPISGSDTKTLLAKADCAMYNAKKNGIDIFVCHPGDGCDNKSLLHSRRAPR